MTAKTSDSLPSHRHPESPTETESSTQEGTVYPNSHPLESQHTPSSHLALSPRTAVLRELTRLYHPAPASSAARQPRSRQIRGIGGAIDMPGHSTGQGTAMINATTTASTTKKATRTTPYAHHRRASAPSIPSLTMSPILPSAIRPALRTFQSQPRDSIVSVTSASMPVNHQHSSGSLPSSLPLSLPSIKQEEESSPVMALFQFRAGNSSSLPSMSSMTQQLSLDSRNIYNDGGNLTNQYIEHWYVVSKESAKCINDLSLLMLMDQASIVTFQPHSYYLVHDAEVGQNNWFRAQACTCTTYGSGFDKARRPATIRDHLAKQPCAPPSLARLAELQLKMMRASSKRVSHASMPDVALSPKLPLMPMQPQHQPASPYYSHDTQYSPGTSYPMNPTSAVPFPTSWLPLPRQLAHTPNEFPGITQPENNGPTFGTSLPFRELDDLEMSRSWPTSSRFGMSSPFFGWSTDSEHAPSSATMSTNKSDLGSTAGMSMSGSSNTFNMSNYHARSNSDMNIHHPYTYGPTAYHAHSLDSTANQIMFADTPEDAKGCDSPLFGAEESLFPFDDM